MSTSLGFGLTLRSLSFPPTARSLFLTVVNVFVNKLLCTEVAFLTVFLGSPRVFIRVLTEWTDHNGPSRHRGALSDIDIPGCVDWSTWEGTHLGFELASGALCQCCASPWSGQVSPSNQPAGAPASSTVHPSLHRKSHCNGNWEQKKWKLGIVWWRLGEHVSLSGTSYIHKKQRCSGVQRRPASNNWEGGYLQPFHFWHQPDRCEHMLCRHPVSAPWRQAFCSIRSVLCAHRQRSLCKFPCR